jgi:hypothetical protein
MGNFFSDTSSKTEVSGKVEVRDSKIHGVGVFAKEAVAANEQVERGIVRRIPIDGDVCESVIHWGQADGKDVWCIISGCGMIYNGSEGEANAKMDCDLVDDKFTVTALKAIGAGEELTLAYDARALARFGKGGLKAVAWPTSEAAITEAEDTKEVASKKTHEEQFSLSWSPPSALDVEAKLGKMNGDGVAVRASKYGDGAFALRAFAKGELVEYGVARRLPTLDGNECTYVFTWSEDRKTWAICGGAAMFYNTSLEPNTEMYRFFDSNRFEIYALRDIAVGEELTHQYRSLRWRTCFNDLPQPEAGH